MHAKLKETHDQFVEKFGFLSSLFGFSKIFGQIHAVLYLSPKPMSLNDIMNALHVSKGSISINIRELEKWGGGNRVWVKGDRRDYYEAEVDFKKIVNKRLLDAINRRLRMLGEISETNHKDYEWTRPEDKSLAEFFEKRMKYLQKNQKKMQTLFNTITKFL